MECLNIGPIFWMEMGHEKYFGREINKVSHDKRIKKSLLPNGKNQHTMWFLGASTMDNHNHQQ